MQMKFLYPLIILSLLAGCKKEKAVIESGSKENHAPVILQVDVSPSTITAGSAISLSVKTRDEDGDKVDLKIKWLVNGVEKAVDTLILNEGEFERGDKITVIITPGDGKTEGEPYSLDLVVENQPPIVKSVELIPPVPSTKEPLKVNAVAFDPEGDPVELKYIWYVDGQAIENENSNVLSNRYFKKGASVYVEVIPSDGISTGVSLLSQPVTVSNTPPQITSTPPTSVAGNRYTYRVTAIDPDGDAINFSLENAPEGMTIDSKTGNITWQISPDQKGEFTFTIIAEDTDGARSMQSVTVNF